MCNDCHDMSTKTISMHNLCIGYNNSSAYRINFVFMSKNDALNFAPNKTPIEIIKEGAFGGTYFRDIYSYVNNKWYRNSWLL